MGKRRRVNWLLPNHQFECLTVWWAATNHWASSISRNSLPRLLTSRVKGVAGSWQPQVRNMKDTNVYIPLRSCSSDSLSHPPELQKWSILSLQGLFLPCSWLSSSCHLSWSFHPTRGKSQVTQVWICSVFFFFLSSKSGWWNEESCAQVKEARRLYGALRAWQDGQSFHHLRQQLTATILLVKADPSEAAQLLQLLLFFFFLMLCCVSSSPCPPVHLVSLHNARLQFGVCKQ